MKLLYPKGHWETITHVARPFGLAATKYYCIDDDTTGEMKEVIRLLKQTAGCGIQSQTAWGCFLGIIVL